MSKDTRLQEHHPGIKTEGEDKACIPRDACHLPHKQSPKRVTGASSSSLALLPSKRKLSCGDETPKCQKVSTMKPTALRKVFKEQATKSAFGSKESNDMKDIDPFVKRNFRDVDDNYFDRPLEPLYPELAEKIIGRPHLETNSEVTPLHDTATSSETTFLPFPDLIQEVSKCPLKPDISLAFSLQDSSFSSLSPFTTGHGPKQLVSDSAEIKSCLQPTNASRKNGNSTFKITSCFKKPRESTCKLTMQIKSAEFETVVAECGVNGVTKSSNKRLERENKENSKADSKRLKRQKLSGSLSDSKSVNLPEITMKAVTGSSVKSRVFTGLPMNN